MHEKKIVELFGGEPAFVKGLASNVQKNLKECDNALFLCFSNRCGSTLFSDVVSKSLRIQRASQCLNHNDAERVYKTRGPYENFYDFLASFCRNVKGNRIFFSKCTWFQLYFIDKYGIIDNFAEKTHFVHNFRKSLLDQAISMCIATQTEAWSSQQEAVRQPVYDRAKIENFIQQFSASFTRFQHYFSYRQTNQLIVPYEDFVSDPTYYVNQIADRLEMKRPGRVDMEIASLKKQGTSINQEFRERFLADEAFSYDKALTR